MRSKLKYFLREAAKNIRQGGIITLATITIIGISLTVLGIFILLVLNLSLFAHSLETQVEITAFLIDDITEEETTELHRKALDLDNVADVNYVSKEEALSRLKKNLGDQSELVEALDTNPLPASLELKVKDTSNIKETAMKLAELEGVEEVSYGQGVVEKLVSVTSLIRAGGLAVVLLLFVTSILIIGNTIRLTISIRREEIEIMRLVGATSWFVRWPFMLEGAIQGFTGGLIASSLIYLVYVLLVSRIHRIVPFLPLVTSNAAILQLVGIIIGLGIILGVTGSLVSLRRFLL